MTLASLDRMEVYCDIKRLNDMVKKMTKWLPSGSQNGLIGKIRVSANAIPVTLEEGWDQADGPRLYKALSSSYEMLSELQDNIRSCRSSLFFSKKQSTDLLLKIDQVKQSITWYQSTFYKRTD